MRKSSTLEPNFVPTGLNWVSCNLLANTWFRDLVVLIIVTGLTLHNRRVALRLKVSIRKRINLKNVVHVRTERLGDLQQTKNPGVRSADYTATNIMAFVCC